MAHGEKEASLPFERNPAGSSRAEVVLAMKQVAFYKSMTTHADHEIWQDVYHVALKSRWVAYIKVTLRENGIVVIQFKEK